MLLLLGLFTIATSIGDIVILLLVAVGAIVAHGQVVEAVLLCWLIIRLIFYILIMVEMKKKEIMK